MQYKILGKITCHNLPLIQISFVISTGSVFHPSATIHPSLSSVLCCLSSSSLMVVGMMSRMAGGAKMCSPENGAELGSRGAKTTVRSTEEPVAEGKTTSWESEERKRRRMGLHSKYTINFPPVTLFCIILTPVQSPLHNIHCHRKKTGNK